MTARDELADLIYSTLNPEIQQDAGWLPTVDGTGNVVSHITADAILARWRLVPIEETPVHVEACPLCRHRWDLHNRMGCGYCTVCITPRYGPDDHIAAQHRAADELTRHDQAAGHYNEPKHTRVMERIGNGPTVNLCNLCRAVWPCSAAIANGTACACGRTDQHGPHED